MISEVLSIFPSHGSVTAPVDISQIPPLVFVVLAGLPMAVILHRELMAFVTSLVISFPKLVLFFGTLAIWTFSAILLSITYGMNSASLSEDGQPIFVMALKWIFLFACVFGLILPLFAVMPRQNFSTEIGKNNLLDGRLTSLRSGLFVLFLYLVEIVVAVFLTLYWLKMNYTSQGNEIFFIEAACFGWCFWSFTGFFLTMLDSNVIHSMNSVMFTGWHSTTSLADDQTDFYFLLFFNETFGYHVHSSKCHGRHSSLKSCNFCIKRHTIETVTFRVFYIMLAAFLALLGYTVIGYFTYYDITHSSNFVTTLIPVVIVAVLYSACLFVLVYRVRMEFVSPATEDEEFDKRRIARITQGERHSDTVSESNDNLDMATSRDGLAPKIRDSVAISPENNSSEFRKKAVMYQSQMTLAPKRLSGSNSAMQSQMTLAASGPSRATYSRSDSRGQIDHGDDSHNPSLNRFAAKTPPKLSASFNGPTQAAAHMSTITLVGDPSSRTSRQNSTDKSDGGGEDPSAMPAIIEASSESLPSNSSTRDAVSFIPGFSILDNELSVTERIVKKQPPVTVKATSATAHNSLTDLTGGWAEPSAAALSDSPMPPAERAKTPSPRPLKKSSFSEKTLPKNPSPLSVNVPAVDTYESPLEIIQAISPSPPPGKPAPKPMWPTSPYAAQSATNSPPPPSKNSTVQSKRASQQPEKEKLDKMPATLEELSKRILGFGNATDTVGDLGEISSQSLKMMPRARGVTTPNSSRPDSVVSGNRQTPAVTMQANRAALANVKFSEPSVLAPGNLVGLINWMESRHCLNVKKRILPEAVQNQAITLTTPMLLSYLQKYLQAHHRAIFLHFEMILKRATSNIATYLPEHFDEVNGTYYGDDEAQSQFIRIFQALVDPNGKLDLRWNQNFATNDDVRKCAFCLIRLMEFIEHQYAASPGNKVT